MTIKFKYTGAGHFYQGIPARDLTEADWAGLTLEQRDLVMGGGLYAGEEPAKAVTTNEEEEVKKSSKGAKNKGRSKKESV